MFDPKILVISLDYDGCSDEPYSRLAIVNHVIRTCEVLTSINKIVVMIGSLRQSVLLDLHNSLNHSSFPHFLSCELIYSEFLPLLQTKIHDMNLTQITEIEFAPLLLSDIYNKLETGVTFNAIQHIFSQPPSMIQQFQFLDGEYPVTNQIGEKVNLLSKHNSRNMADLSKHSLIYAQSHHLKLAYPETQILFQFYDDRENILEGLHHLYSNASELLPPEFYLELIHHESLPEFTPCRYKTLIRGLGELNPQYHHHILMASELAQWKNIKIDSHQFKSLIDAVCVASIEATFSQNYIALRVPEYKVTHISKLIPIDALKKFEENFDYFEDCPGLFKLAYEREKNKRQYGYGRAYYEKDAELDAILEIYVEEAFPGLRKEINEYANFRCNQDESKEKTLLASLTPIIRPIPKKAPPLHFFAPPEVDAAKLLKLNPGAR